MTKYSSVTHKTQTLLITLLLLYQFYVLLFGILRCGGMLRLSQTLQILKVTFFPILHINIIEVLGRRMSIVAPLNLPAY